MCVWMHMHSCTVSAESEVDKEVCIFQCAAAQQPGGQDHSVCLNIWSYGWTGTQVKTYKETVHGGLCEMWLHKTQCGWVRKGYGATPSRGRHKESLPGGHMNTGCPSHAALIWVQGEDRGGSTVLFTVSEAREWIADSSLTLLGFNLRLSIHVLLRTFGMGLFSWFHKF